MGYTHYWKIPSTDEWLKTWPQLVCDAKFIIQNCKVKLAGPDDEGEGQSQIDQTRIALNGGDGERHQPFILEPAATTFECCKTAHKPYDLPVAAILLRASQLAGDGISVRSDGLWDVEDEWGYVRAFYQKLWPGEEIKMPSEMRKSDDPDSDEDTEKSISFDELVELMIESAKLIDG